MNNMSDREELLHDIQSRFNIRVMPDDPSLVAWYLQSQILNEFNATLKTIAEQRVKDLNLVKELSDNFNLNMNAAIQESITTILELSETKLVRDTLKSRQEANQAVLSGINAALTKVDETFNSQCDKLEKIVNKTQKKRIQDNVLIFGSGIVVGLIMTVIMAATILMLR